MYPINTVSLALESSTILLRAFDFTLLIPFFMAVACNACRHSFDITFEFPHQITISISQALQFCSGLWSGLFSGWGSARRTSPHIILYHIIYIALSSVEY